MNFNNDVWYYPATYWFWHYVPSKDEIDRQIEDMKNKGVSAAVIADNHGIKFERGNTNEQNASIETQCR